jgi:hypothetical protein
MTIDLAAEVRQYLDDVDAAQEALGVVGARKNGALRTADAAALVALADEEATLATRLRKRLGERDHLLSRARVAGHRVTTITELVDDLTARDATGPVSAGLRERLHRTRSTARRLQRETWVHWIVARRTVEQYGELLDLIANHGRRAATYAAPTASSVRRASSTDGTTGGAVLDASA